MPKARTNTHVLTTRLDSRYLATLIRFWKNEGKVIVSSSDLIRSSLETFVEFLVLNNKIDFVDSTEDSLEVIESLGLRARVNPRNLAQRLTQEDSQLEIIEPVIDSKHRERSRKQPSSSVELDAAMSKFQQSLEEDLKKRLEDEKSRTQKFKDNILKPTNENENN